MECHLKPTKNSNIAFHIKNVEDHVQMFGMNTVSLIRSVNTYVSKFLVEKSTKSRQK